MARARLCRRRQLWAIHGSCRGLPARYMDRSVCSWGSGRDTASRSVCSARGDPGGTRSHALSAHLLVGIRAGHGLTLRPLVRQTVGPLMASQCLLGPVCAASPEAPAAPTRSVNREGLNHTAGSRRLQQGTEKWTCANLPLRPGLFSQDFQDPTAGKRQGVRRPRGRQEAAAMCALCSLGGLPRGSFLQLLHPMGAPSSKSALGLFLLGLVPIQTRSQQDPSGCP